MYADDVVEALLSAVTAEGRLLADAYAAVEPLATVPGLDWCARDVIAHTGAVHRWAADILRRSLATNEAGGSRAFGWSGPDDALTDWYRDGLDTLVDVLRASPADLDCFTFVAGVPAREFWIRRQAHETAIHRVDVEAAAGRGVTRVDPWFAQDGLGELVGVFARRPPFVLPCAGRLVLAASDGPSWTVSPHPDGNRTDVGDPVDDEADAVVRGTSDSLYRWAWNRAAEVEVTGDPDVVAAWQQTVRIT